MLDIGQSSDEAPYVFAGDTTALMSMLMSGLPHLTHLDISGTNLAGWVKDQSVSHRPTAHTTDRFILALNTLPIPAVHG